jgi:hypothetical protein
MKFASRSAIESDSSAKAGSKISKGASEMPPMLDLPDSRKEDLEDGRRGVVGRDVGRRVFEPDRLTLSSSGLFEDDIMIADLFAFVSSFCTEALEHIVLPCRV